MNEPSAPDGPPPTPAWVKAFGLLGLVLLLVVAYMHLTGQGVPTHGIAPTHGTTVP